MDSKREYLFRDGLSAYLISEEDVSFDARYKELKTLAKEKQLAQKNSYRLFGSFKIIKLSENRRN